MDAHAYQLFHRFHHGLWDPTEPSLIPGIAIRQVNCRLLWGLTSPKAVQLGHTVALNLFLGAWIQFLLNSPFKSASEERRSMGSREVRGANNIYQFAQKMHSNVNLKDGIRG